MTTAKKALVTGGSRGIGRGIVVALAAAGYDTAFSYRSMREEADSLQRQVRQESGRRCFAFQAELHNSGAGSALVEQAVEALGGLDLLVNNAGATQFESILSLTEEAVDRLLALDFKSYLFCMQAAARRMIADGTRGSIISITSTRAQRAYPGDAVYGGVKAAIQRASQSAALDLAPYGIRVNCVAPGAIVVRSKEYLQTLPGAPVDFWDNLGKRIPLERSGLPEDVAQAVVYLASEGAAYVTGAVLPVDGGLTLPGMPELGSEGWGAKKGE